MGRPVQGGAILEVSNLGHQHGQTVMNTWHYRWVGAPSPVEDGDVLISILKAFIQGGAAAGLLPSLRAMCNENITWDSIRYQWITPIRYSPVTYTTGTGPGANEAQSLPPNVCGVVTLQSMFGGPGSTGRKHFGGLSVDDVSGGSMTPSWKSQAIAVMELMTATVPTEAEQINSLFVPIIYDRVDPAVSIPWDSWTIQDTTRVIRRRTVGVGI